MTPITPHQKRNRTKVVPPSNLKKPKHYLRESSTVKRFQIFTQYLTCCSHCISISQDEWRLITSTISHSNTKVELAIKIMDPTRLWIKRYIPNIWFFSEADDPLNTQITGLDVRPGNLWRVFERQLDGSFTQQLTLALNSSMESWTVGSGGSDSRPNF